MKPQSEKNGGSSPWTLHRTPIPLDMVGVIDGQPDQSYRIPSWRVAFDALPGGFDLRVHRGLNSDAAWTLTEASTGMKVYDGWGDHETMDELLGLFVQLTLPKLTPEILAKSIADGKAKLAARTPLPSKPANFKEQEIADALDVAECCVHDQIKDPGEREHVQEGLKKVRKLALSAVSSSAAQPVAQVMRAMANDGKCGPVVWFRSALDFPDGTNLYAGTPPSAIAPKWVYPTKDMPGPELDGRMWFIFERLDDGEYNICGEYYYHFEGWATDTEVLAWWSEPMVAPAMPSGALDVSAERKP